jgi:hypothetical protein
MLPSTCVDDAVVGGSGVEFLQPCRKHTVDRANHDSLHSLIRTPIVPKTL